MTVPKAPAGRDSLIVPPASYLDPADPQAYFAQRQSLEIELGSGDGGFLAAWATQHPERNFLGLERLLGRLRKLDRKGRRLRLNNLALMRIEAAYFVTYLLPPESVDAFHIYFPDPWPKRKHRKHRLVEPGFARASHRSLRPGGIVSLRTDDEDYFAQMEAVYGAHQGFEPAPADESLRSIQTDFERVFAGQGIAARYAAFRKV